MTTTHKQRETMSCQRLTYTFIHDWGCMSPGITKEEYAASMALLGLVKSTPENTYDDAAVLAERAFSYAEELHMKFFHRTGDYLWRLQWAFPTNRQDGTWRDRFDFAGLLATDWVATQLLIGVVRTLSGLNGDYFVKPYVRRTLEYTDALMSLLSEPASRTAFSYRGEPGLTFRDRVETRILSECVAGLPEPLKADEIVDVIRSARALTENEPANLAGNTIGRWFAERMSPWLIRGIEPHTTAQHIYRFASQLSETLGLNPTNPAMPRVRYRKRKDGGRHPVVTYRGLTIRAWVAGEILGNLVCRMSTLKPWEDAVDRALTYADALISEYMAQEFDITPDDPAYPSQIARCQGSGYTYEHSNGLDVTLWLAGQIMGSLARRDIPDISRAAKYAIYQAHRLFVESAKREREAIARFKPKAS